MSIGKAEIIKINFAMSRFRLLKLDSIKKSNLNLRFNQN